jgi:hypothetical protein
MATAATFGSFLLLVSLDGLGESEEGIRLLVTCILQHILTADKPNGGHYAGSIAEN